MHIPQRLCNVEIFNAHSTYPRTQNFGVKCLAYFSYFPQHECELERARIEPFKRRYGKKLLKFTLFLFRLASSTLTFNFFILLKMEEFLLTKEPLDIVRISTALYIRVEQGEWTGVLEKEVKNFANVLKKVLE